MDLFSLDQKPMSKKNVSSVLLIRFNFMYISYLVIRFPYIASSTVNNSITIDTTLCRSASGSGGWDDLVLTIWQGRLVARHFND